MEVFLGEIRIFTGNYAPSGWMFCEGQLLKISENTALYSIIGTQYGGDGIQTFALPDLSGKVAVNQGAGPGLTPRQIGETGGSSDVSLVRQELPAHNHLPVFNNEGTSNSPAAAVWADPGRRSNQTYSSNSTSKRLMNPSAIGSTGGNSGHNNRQPFLTLKYIISVAGFYPTRPSV